MGCFHSKSESSDPHFNVFRVENVDESGTVISIGRIEITETHLVFHRESSDSTKWPLHSLRRYGFEAGVFSFEAGRRCDTGEGIYAFHCRRASLLFRSLQQQIQLLNVVQESGPYPLSGLSPSPHGRPTLQATIIHRSSIDGGHTNMQTLITSNLLRQSGEPGQILEGPRSSLSADILEVTPLYPHSHSSGNHIANVYQLRDFKREHNNNQSTDNNASDVLHSYTNDLSRDLAILRNKLRQETAINTMRDIEEEAHFLQLIAEKVSSNNANNTLSPTRSTSSEHYAQLTIEQKQLQQQQQEGPRLYVNVVPNENVPENTKKVDSTTQPVIPTTPVTPKQVEYCNLTVGNKVEVNTYANLMLSDMADSGKSLVSNTSEHNHKYSESDTFTSLSPVEELEVNYAVLDIESHKEADKMTKDMPSPENVSHSIKKDENTASCPSQTRSRLISQSSMEKPVAIVTALVTAPQVNIGYTTIDFDKTVALTSVAAGADTNMEGPRKTRNNSCSVIYGSPNSADKSK